MIPSFFSNLKGPRNTCIYGLGHTKSTRRNSSGLEIDYVEKIVKGTNLQNIEKLARKLYIADFGKAFVQRDQSGAEALIVAYLCRAGRYRELFNNNIKSHVYVALHVFANVWEQEMNQYAGDIKLDIKEFTSLAIPDLPKHPQWKSLNKLIKKSDEWPAEKRYYYIAKQICHSSNYDIKPNAFSLNTLIKSKGRIVIKKQEAEKYLEFYHSTFPEIREWHRDVRSSLEKSPILYNLFNHPYYFDVNKFNGEDKLFKEIYAIIPQSTVATITAQAVSNTYDYIVKNKLQWDILADTHDSFMTQCPTEEIEHCNRIMKQYLNVQLTAPRGEVFSMKSEGMAGFNWAPYKEGINDNGLKEIED